MKKIIAMLLVLVMACALIACDAAPTPTTPTTTEATTGATEGTTEATEGGEEAAVMTYAEYEAAELDSQVTVECYVQATQSWWEDKITVYAQDADGAYFLYEMACSEEDSAKLTEGVKIRVTGTKGAWEGEVEIMDATFEFVEGADTYVAEPVDVTELLANEEELIKKQNQKVSFKGLTIKKIEYKNGEPGDDIYVTVTLDEKDYDFCVERYLTDPDTEVYKAFAELKAGDVVDMEGFLYWYQSVNTHITAVSKAA